MSSVIQLLRRSGAWQRTKRLPYNGPKAWLHMTGVLLSVDASRSRLDLQLPAPYITAEDGKRARGLVPPIEDNSCPGMRNTTACSERLVHYQQDLAKQDYYKWRDMRC